MDQPKVERMLRLMKLLTANNRYTIEDLGNMLEMSQRTIYRYIDTFREAGFVVKKSNGFIRLDKQSKYFKDISELVHFTDEEAYILKSAIESIDENNIIKQNLKSKLYSVYDYKILAECVTKGSNAKNVNNLAEAMENHKQVRLKGYRSASSNSISDRIIEPYKFTTNYIQVWGYEIPLLPDGSPNPHAKGMNKMFKVSRISDTEVLDSGWQFEPEHKSAYIDIFRISSHNQFPIKLKLGLKAASLLVEEFPLAEKDLTKISDTQYILETKVCNYEGVGRFVLGLLDDIEILESEKFITFLKQRVSILKN